ncbi:helix-turn-helix domain-containing protein [Meiothermus granaticius]|uniref:Helix-turn-helix domain protein n=1 Tax=Meiothermus granaticius NBRC 107808 TaxID=1227551 RepID=A0A399FCN6_9DEIN|nr:helix-turn-helix transcriptional regulator [Meiothermus granaticius]RIH94018.1 hypothetical protein Mgrana_00104 [Meiothermus granaticius NBRC 107808]GEM88153.1 hypothetical protein MGR01S_27780 [Meiothermus granaticius NBRC 107808]
MRAGEIVKKELKATEVAKEEHDELAAKNFRKLREQFASQAEFARLSGSNTSTVWGIESGRFALGPKTLRRFAPLISEATGIDLGRVLILLLGLDEAKAA